MSVQLDALVSLVNELKESGQDIDAAIAAAELKVKQLRALKASLAVPAKPSPRVRKPKGGESA